MKIKTRKKLEFTDIDVLFVCYVLDLTSNICNFLVTRGNLVSTSEASLETKEMLHFRLFCSFSNFSFSFSHQFCFHFQDISPITSHFYLDCFFSFPGPKFEISRLENIFVIFNKVFQILTIRN